MLSPCSSPQILGFVAKGSFGTILKVLDCGREKVCAVKVSAAPWGPWVPPPVLVPLLDSAFPAQVVPKVEVLRRDTLKQCKEEVSIQVRRGGGEEGPQPVKGFGMATGTPRRPWEPRMVEAGSPAPSCPPFPGGGVGGSLTLSVLLCPQRQVRHPFVHGLGDSWQGQRHLFISE